MSKKPGMTRRNVLATAGAASVASAGTSAIPNSPSSASNFGQCSDDVELRAAWRAFCRKLERAGDGVFKAYNPATPLHRADGFRFLMQNLGQAFDLAYETKDTKYPVIHAFSTALRKLGGDNADCLYQQAWIDGETTYRISGTRGTVRLLNFTVQGPRPALQPGTSWPSLHEPFGDIPEANMLGDSLKTALDGSFELYIGGPRRPFNWLPTTPGSRKLFIRQVFDKWSEEPARFTIERIGMTTPRPAPMPSDMVAAMAWGSDFVEGVMEDWPDNPFKYTNAHYDKWPNRFPPELGSDASLDKRRGRAVKNMAWEIKPDEAMILEFPNQSGLWMLTNMGQFFNSLDYLYRPVSYTPSRTAVDKDGIVRMVICADDPGYHNWLDTQGLVKGNLTYRHYLSDEFADLKTQLVKRDKLATTLPDYCTKSSPEQRITQLQERFNGIRRRIPFA